MNAILMTKEYWLNSQLSIARFTGRAKINGEEYWVVGEQRDLVDCRFEKYYTKLGRSEFIRIIEQNAGKDKESIMQVMKDALKAKKQQK